MNLKLTLRAIGMVVLDEVDRNPDFAQRLQLAIGLTEASPDLKKTIEKKTRTRAAAIIDPVAIFADNGEDALRQQLKSLPLGKLLDIVAEFGMDTSKLVMKWKDSERVSEHIIDNAKRRSVKGDAFRA